MKLLLISVKSKASRGGIATWTKRFLDKCEKHDIFCDLVNTEMIGKRVEQNTHKRRLFDEVKRSRRIFFDLKRSLKESQYDAAHLNTSCGTFGLFRDYLIAKAIKKKHIRLIVHFHCDIPFWVHNSLSLKCLCKLAVLADERLVLCENSRKYLQDKCKVSSIKTPNFIDDWSILEGDKQIADVLSTVIYVGKVMEAKGSKEILELASRFPKITFKLVGDIVGEENRVDIPKNVIMLGGMPYDDVLKQLDSADVFLFPSHSEGFSLALTEAMARGLPCIATDVGANSDMLADGCGVVVAKGDVDAMEQAIKGLFDAEERKKASRNAVVKVKAEYTANPVMEKLMESYRGAK